MSVRLKVDYRLVEIPQDAEVRAIVVTDVPPNEVLEEVKKTVEVTKVFDFMRVVKVRGKASTLKSLGEKPFVRYVMLEDLGRP